MEPTLAAHQSKTMNLSPCCLLPAAEVGGRLNLESGRYLGPGLIAEDLPEAIPAVLRSVGCGPIQDD